MTKEQAREKIASLVEVFDEHYDSYHNHAYDEAKVRVDFINKFFKALGWDIDNEQGYAEAYREVILEDKLKIGGQTKAPDYGFTIGGQKQRKFYVEAKKPSIVLKTDKEPAWQLKNYGWNAGAPISILTNFAEFAVYDCSKHPKKTDSAGISRVRYFTYKDYVKEFDFIWDTFSKESILKGRFDKFVQSDTDRRGTATVDKFFLESLNDWRKRIATSIAKNNHKLNEEQIGYVVQLTLDRLIFLRFCEDRGVEAKQSLWSALKKGGNLYQNLFSLFKEADRKYNSGLFDFKKDNLSEGVTIDNKIIKNVVEELYPPASEYNFSILPVEILGHAYEQFLGKVIRVTNGHIVKIDDKPEVRKAGGVYYTPQYIVEYIVSHTVGELIKGKTPKQIEDIKIVDPACGSGSFLLGAFEYLMEYHTKYYIDKGLLDKKKDSPLTPDGRLTSTEKKRILTNNIFGVDIDTQAVEVTKLSLLLKAMEGETSASISHQLTLTHERILPNLDNNIKRGNSLIGPDFYDSELNLEPEIEKKINVFDWKKGFPKVFEKEGFDAVIGNPPYSLIGSDRQDEQEYLKSKYELTSYKTNTYVLFLEKGLKLLSQKQSKLGLIIPKSLVFNTYFDTTRKRLLSDYLISEIVEIREKVFADAEVGDSILFFGEKANSPLKNVLSYYKVINIFPSFQVINSFKNSQQILLEEFDGKFFSSQIKIRVKTNPLSYYCDVFNGLNPGNVRHILFSTEKKNNKYKKLVLGKDIKRYDVDWSGTWVNYDSSLKDKLKPSDIKSKSGMTAQTKVDFALREEKIFTGNKILVRKTSDHIIAALDKQEYYYDSLSYGVKLRKDDGLSLYFILGLLNSTLINYIHNGLSDNKDKVFAKVLATNISQLPFPIINFKNKNENKLHDEIVKHVEILLRLNEEKQQETLPNKIEQLNTRIAHSEQRIDESVYELYDLTKEEIEIIEKETAKA